MCLPCCWPFADVWLENPPKKKNEEEEEKEDAKVYVYVPVSLSQKSRSPWQPDPFIENASSPRLFPQHRNTT